MKLFCLTYAGGTAAFYNQLEGCIKPDIKLIKLEYAGHGKRHREAFYSSFDELAQDQFRLIRDILDMNEPYALIGYSMGSISVIEILRKILAAPSIIHKPTHIFLAAHEPHVKTELDGFSDEERDEYVKERTIRFGAVPERLVNNPVFWRIYLPIYRADYGIIGKYRFENLCFKTDIPATVFYSEDDTPIAEMRKWSNIFTGSCDYIEYTGNHFFLQNHTEEIAEEIANALV